jgi:hypothetical protein
MAVARFGRFRIVADLGSSSVARNCDRKSEVCKDFPKIVSLALRVKKLDRA